MKKLSYFLMAALFAVVLFSGCAKDGIDGIDGDDGINGINGASGNANVTSYTFTVNQNQWTSFGTYGQSNYGYETALTVPAITQYIVDNGVVIVYLQSGTSTNMCLPLQLTYNGFTTTYAYLYTNNEVDISVMDDDLRTLAPNVSYTFRVIVIEGNAGKKSFVNYADYEATIAYYGLK